MTTLTINAAAFEDSTLGAHAARTDDGRAFSILFDAFGAECRPADGSARLARAEGFIQCEGRGWLSLSVRGALSSTGAHGFAHLLGRANGQRLQAAATEGGGPFDATLVVAVDRDSRVRLSLLLLAQRDFAEARSTAACWVDSLDIVVFERPLPRTRRHAQVSRGELR